MRIKRFLSVPRVMLLLAAMLLAQSLAAAHYDLDSAHAAGDPCAVCASISVFGAANLSAAQPLLPPTSSLLPLASPALVAHSIRIDRIQIRGPPVAA